MVRNTILAALRGDFGKEALPPLGTVVDDIYTVILCPVCSRKTLDNYSICRHCGWEYDGFGAEHFSAANGATLEEYRRAYIRIRQEWNDEMLSDL